MIKIIILLSPFIVVIIFRLDGDDNTVEADTTYPPINGTQIFRTIFSTLLRRGRKPFGYIALSLYNFYNLQLILILLPPPHLLQIRYLS